jgi:Ca2+-binding RTX toxin-like protein
LRGGNGDDEIRGLGDKDDISGGDGNDVIYAGPGDDSFLPGTDGDDVIYEGPGDEMEIIGADGADVNYGGDGNDFIAKLQDGQPDKLYCGKGKDEYLVEEKIDYVSNSCEKGPKVHVPKGPA